MKRLLCLVVVVVMATACCVSFAEENESEKDRCLNEMKMMKVLYKLAPETFNAEYIMRTYLDLMIYINIDALEYYNVGYYLTREKEETAVDYVRKYAISVTNLVKMATNGYYDWLNGNMTDEEYAEVLMMIVNGMLESIKQ